MIVAFDTGMLSLALHQTARIPVIPGTTTPVSRPRERIEFLIGELSKDKATIVIPTPALAEFLVVVEEAGPKYLQQIDKSSRFDIQPFDEMAAIEAAQMFRAFKAAGDKRGGATGDWQKVKVDQQIVAIAKTRRAERIYASDQDIVSIAKSWNLDCIPVWELPLPPEEPQQDLFAAGEPEPATYLAASTAIAPLASQSPGDEQVKETQPAPPRRAIHGGDPEPPPPDSSPTSASPPRSKQ